MAQILTDAAPPSRCVQVVRVNQSREPERGVLGSAMHVAYRAQFNEDLPLTFEGVRYKVKDLIARCRNVETVVANTQPLYRYKPAAAP